MKVLVDITHPAHVHFFKHAIWAWQDRDHEVFITARDKDLTIKLLDHYGFKYVNLGGVQRGLWGLCKELILREQRLYPIMQQVRPDLLVAVGGTFIVHVGKLTRTPTIVFTDTENATLANMITFPFASVICTPTCYEGRVGKKQVTYEGYQELAYLHPNYFSPNPSVLSQLGLRETDSFCVLRLISWGAGHDVRDHGFTDVRAAVQALSQYGRVLITSEKKLDAEFETFRITAPPEQIHHLLYYARLYMGESATMASESAILGTPAIFVSTSTRGYTNEQGKRYGLVYTFSDPKTAQQDGLEMAMQLLGDEDVKHKWRMKRDVMLRDKIDVTKFVVELVENFAETGSVPGLCS